MILNGIRLPSIIWACNLGVFVILMWDVSDHLFMIAIFFDGTFIQFNYRLDYQFLEEILVLLCFPGALAILLGHGRANLKLLGFCSIVSLKMYLPLFYHKFVEVLVNKQNKGFLILVVFYCTIFITTAIMYFILH